MKWCKIIETEEGIQILVEKIFDDESQSYAVRYSIQFNFTLMRLVVGGYESEEEVDKAFEESNFDLVKELFKQFI